MNKHKAFDHQVQDIVVYSAVAVQRQKLPTFSGFNVATGATSTAKGGPSLRLMYHHHGSWPPLKFLVVGGNVKACPLPLVRATPPKQTLATQPKRSAGFPREKHGKKDVVT